MKPTMWKVREWSFVALLPLVGGCGCEAGPATSGAGNAAATDAHGASGAAGASDASNASDATGAKGSGARSAAAGSKESSSGGAGAAAWAAPVAVAKAERRDIPLQIHAIGTVESPASVVLKPQMDGRVVEVKFVEGDDVKAGDVLLVLDQRPAQAALALAEAGLARDKAMAKDASLNADQIASVNDRRAVAERVVQQSRAEADAAQAGVAADEAQVETARLMLDYCTLRAPFDGRTGTLGVRVGSVVKQNETELVTISQVAPVRVTMSVPQDRLPQVVTQQAKAPLDVEVTAADGSTTTGKLSFVDNSVDSTTGTIRLMATFPNADRRLWPGQYVQAAIDVSLDKGAVVVPARTVQTGQQGSYVFVVRDDRTVELRAVDVLRGAGDVTLIAKGLQGGETVVTDGQLRLVDGAPVSFDAAAAVPPADSSVAPARGAAAPSGG